MKERQRKSEFTNTMAKDLARMLRERRVSPGDPPSRGKAGGLIATSVNPEAVAEAPAELAPALHIVHAIVNPVSQAGTITTFQEPRKVKLHYNFSGIKRN